MSISNEDTRIVFVGDGSDASPYPISFPLRDDDDVEVIYVTDATGAEVVKTKTTDYTIALASNFATAELTLVTTVPATGETMLIRRNQPATQQTTYENFNGFPAAVIEGDFDKNTMNDLTSQEQLDRAILVAKGHPDANLPLTALNLIGNAEKIIAVKDDETGLELIVNADSSDATAGPDPGLSTDNAVVRWDDVTGRLLQNSVVTIGDTGNIVTAGTYTAGSGVVVLTNADGTIREAAINSAIAGTNITYTSGVLSVGAGGGLGDVTGPASSTDLAIARWDGATGKLLQDSSVTLTSGGTISNVFVIRSSETATQSTPPYSFTGRTGDGLFSSGVDIVGLATGGIERLSLSATLMDIASGVDVTINGGDLTVSGTITAGSGATLLTNADGTIKQGAINSAIAGTGITYTSGVLSVVASLGGDVVGPGSSTNEAVARFDLATGKLLQNSVMLVSDTGAVTGVTTLTTSGNITTTAGNIDVQDGTATITGNIAGTLLTVFNGTGSGATADGSANDVVFESSAALGMSLLVPNSGTAKYVMGSVGSPVGTQWIWADLTDIATFGTNVVGAILRLEGDVGIPNLDLSGTTASELATFVRDVTLTNGDLLVSVGDMSVLAGTVNFGTNDSIRGTLNVFGDSASAGGLISIFNGATSDGTTENFTITPTTAYLAIGPAADFDQFRIGSAGGVTLTAGDYDTFAGLTYMVNNTQVVTARQTGWGAPTGTATRTTFVTSTVTLPQLAERVKALIDDLTTHGLIGA